MLMPRLVNLYNNIYRKSTDIFLGLRHCEVVAENIKING